MKISAVHIQPTTRAAEDFTTYTKIATNVTTAAARTRWMLMMAA